MTVVDNSSSAAVRDVATMAGATYLDPGANLGFAAGVNRALGQRQRPRADVLLLNPDAVISVDDVRLLSEALAEDPGLGSVGPAQVDASGTTSQVAWPFPSPGRAWLDATGLGRLGAQEGFVIGSVLLLRSEALTEVGGLDERFFLYAEETDWARRAAARGWRHAVVTRARAVHVGAATSTDPVRRDELFFASQELYFRKHFGDRGWGSARAAQLVGSAGRWLVLSGDRREAAQRRLRLYSRGPVRAATPTLETTDSL
jgi:GT2 family glycosyltransferase